MLGEDTKARLALKEHPDTGVFAEGLVEEVVEGVAAINAVMAAGERSRTVGATLMNAVRRPACVFPCTMVHTETGGFPLSPW